MDFNYQTICHHNLLKDLPKRNEEVIVRRFGLKGERETLESIGRAYDITRERVRQIQDQGLRELVEKADTPLCRNVFQYFSRYLKASGSLKREDILLSQLGGDKFQNHVFFLLTLGGSFYRFPETEKLYAFWAIDKNSINIAKKPLTLSFRN